MNSLARVTFAFLTVLLLTFAVLQPVPTAAQSTLGGGTGNTGGYTLGGNTGNTGGTTLGGGTGNTGGGSGGGLINPLGTTSLPQLITDILQLVVKIGAVIVVFMLVYVGFLFVVAQGSENKLEEAKRALLYTIIGALILLGAEAIAQGIQATVSALSG